MFAMNPMWDSQRIMLHRRKTLRLPKVAGAVGSPDDDDREQRRRDEGREQLREMQARYFQMPKEELDAGLKLLAADRHPELAATVSRLNVASNHRDSINAMLDDSRFDRDLAIAFGRSLTLTPADAGFAKEQYLQSLTRSGGYSSAIRSVRRIEEIDPALIGLERDWFIAIRNRRTPWFSDANMSLLLGAGALIAGMIVRFAMYAFESGR